MPKGSPAGKKECTRCKVSDVVYWSNAPAVDGKGVYCLKCWDRYDGKGITAKPSIKAVKTSVQSGVKPAAPPKVPPKPSNRGESYGIAECNTCQAVKVVYGSTTPVEDSGQYCDECWKEFKRVGVPSLPPPTIREVPSLSTPMLHVLTAIRRAQAGRQGEWCTGDDVAAAFQALHGRSFRQVFPEEKLITVLSDLASCNWADAIPSRSLSRYLVASLISSDDWNRVIQEQQRRTVEPTTVPTKVQPAPAAAPLTAATAETVAQQEEKVQREPHMMTTSSDASHNAAMAPGGLHLPIFVGEVPQGASASFLPPVVTAVGAITPSSVPPSHYALPTNSTPIPLADVAEERAAPPQSSGNNHCDGAAHLPNLTEAPRTSSSATSLQNQTRAMTDAMLRTLLAIRDAQSEKPEAWSTVATVGAVFQKQHNGLAVNHVFPDATLIGVIADLSRLGWADSIPHADPKQYLVASLLHPRYWDSVQQEFQARSVSRGDAGPRAFLDHMEKEAERRRTAASEVDARRKFHGPLFAYADPAYLKHPDTVSNFRTVEVGMRPPEGLLGETIRFLRDVSDNGGGDADDELAPATEGCSVYLRTTDPFCLLCFGKPGSGKSNTMNVVLENHLLPPPATTAMGASRKLPFATLAFHYGSTYGCEFLGLCKDPVIAAECVVLVSPTNPQRRAMYERDGFRVEPMLLDWAMLSAEHIMALMHVDALNPPLYGCVLLKILREYQRRGDVISYAAFKKELMGACDVPGQRAPLLQRLSLIESILHDSGSSHAGRAVDMGRLFQANRLVVVDMTDPLMTPHDANDIFFVLLSMFRHGSIAAMRKAGKIVAFDEAHKFFSSATSKLCQEISSLVEVMRHEGTRIIISTQCPEVVPLLVFELCTLAMLHNQHAPRTWSFLQAQFPLPQALFHRVVSLQPGEGLMVSPMCLRRISQFVRVRRRVTADLGETLQAEHELVISDAEMSEPSIQHAS